MVVGLDGTCVAHVAVTFLLPTIQKIRKHTKGKVEDTTSTLEINIRQLKDALGNHRDSSIFLVNKSKGIRKTCGLFPLIGDKLASYSVSVFFLKSPDNLALLKQVLRHGRL